MNEAAAHAREQLVEAILAFLSSQKMLPREAIRQTLEREIDAAGEAAVLALKARLAQTHDGWEYFPPDPLARRLHHVLAGGLLTPDSSLSGEWPPRGEGPTVLVANHLSYADANMLEILLERAGAYDVAARLTAMAGPKVFLSRQRLFSSLCFGTIKTPQTASVSSEEAVMTAREVAAAARRVIGLARERLRAGDLLVLFGEGTRSRTREMQRLLPGVARYLEEPGTRVVPVGIAGTEALYPIGDDGIHPARVTIRLGAVIDVAAATARARGDRKLLVDAIGVAIADQLPAEYRGVYAAAHVFADARTVLRG